MMDRQNSNQTTQTGKRQRKDTIRVTENADPLLPKNKKAKVSASAKEKAKPKQTKQATTKVTMPHSSSSRRRSVEIEDVDDEDGVTPHAPLRNPHRIIEATDGSDDDDSEVMEVNVEEEKPEETAEEQLSKFNLGLPFMTH
jgi:hypothetical protein